MRKFVLFALTFFSLTAFAGVEDVKQAIASAPSSSNLLAPEAKIRDCEMTPIGYHSDFSLAPTINASNNLIVRYKRPAGSFYTPMRTSDGALFTYFTPFMAVHPTMRTPFYDWTLGATADATYKWRIQLTNWYDVQEGEMPPLVWLDYEAQNPWVVYENNDVDSVPDLTVTSNGDSGSYHLYGSLYNETTREVTRDWVTVVSTPSMTDMIAPDRFLYSSKYFALNAREDIDGWDGKLILGSTSNVDPYFWLGKPRKESGAMWNATAAAFEKPEHPYVLRSIAIEYTYLKVRTGKKAKLHARVYRMRYIPPYSSSESVYVDPSNLEFIAEGYCEVNSNTGGTRPDANYKSGMLTFPLKEKDGILEYEVTPEIDFPILVLIDGYDNTAIQQFTFYISNDNIDDGYGELGYICQLDDNGDPSVIRGINNTFKVGGIPKEQLTAPTIFLDVEQPFLSLQNMDDMPVLLFPGHPEDQGKPGRAKFGFYSSKPYGMGWQIGDYETGVIPDWVDVSLSDSINPDGTYSNCTNCTLTVQALPSYLNGRRTNLKFSYPGASLILIVNQGEIQDDPVFGDVNSDGKVNVSDVNLIVSAILNKDYDTKYDLNDDGYISVTDVNLVVSIILSETDNAPPAPETPAQKLLSRRVGTASVDVNDFLTPTLRQILAE